MQQSKGPRAYTQPSERVTAHHTTLTAGQQRTDERTDERTATCHKHATRSCCSHFRILTFHIIILLYNSKYMN